MKHIQTTTRRHRMQRPQIATLMYCQPDVSDGFCYAWIIQDGFKGILTTGGFAGISEFKAVFPTFKR